MAKKQKEHRSVRGLTGKDKKYIQDMWLPEGITCSDCYHFPRCNGIFGTVAEDVDCQFHPNRFIEKEQK